MTNPIKAIFKKCTRTLGFDIISINNLENEIKRREKERELAKIERIKHFSQLSKPAYEKARKGVCLQAGRDTLETEGARLLRPASTVLDIGCAFRPQQYVNGIIHICCEPYREYMNRLMAETSSDTKYVYLNCNLTQVCELLPASSVDAAFLIDVLEHVDKSVGQNALARLKQICRSQIAIFTPLGFMEQEPEEEGTDPWGMGGVEWQRHLSGWTPEDFPVDEGWSTVVCEDFFLDDAYGRKLETPIGAFWAIWSAT